MTLVALPTKNRSRIARERAGLTLLQASTILGITAETLIWIEEADSAFADADHAAMADVYGVNVEWLRGDVPQFDFPAVDKINGADKLYYSDRQTIAEFLASTPRRQS